MTDLSHPGVVLKELASLANDLALRQNEYETAASAWFKAKRDKEHDYAVAFMNAVGTDGQRRVIALQETALKGKDEEAAYEAAHRVMKVLETRASVLQSILKAQSR